MFAVILVLKLSEITSEGPSRGLCSALRGLYGPLGAKGCSREGLGGLSGGSKKAPRPEKSSKRRSWERTKVVREWS